jgi:hypothetical protein
MGTLRCVGWGLVLLLSSRPALADEPLRGWVGLAGRNTFGFTSPDYADFGVYAMAGLWVANEHLQPFMRFGWSQGAGIGSTLDTYRVGAGLAAGASFAHEHGWIGGALALEVVDVFPWKGSSDVLGMAAFSFVLQLRVLHRFLLGVEAGPDLYSAPLRTANGALEWDLLRVTAGLRVGYVFGQPVQ